MTNDVEPARLIKWPFFLADLVLVGLASWVLYRSLPPSSPWEIALCLGALAAACWGAWLFTVPFTREHEDLVRLIESASINSAIDRIQNLETVAAQIATATSHWQGVQEHSSKTLGGAREISDRMAAETREFRQFLERANDQERAHLRLEVEKLKRGENDWLQVVLRIMDHIYALNQAASRSGQPNLINQLGQFQLACRDTIRRIGLNAFTPDAGEPYDAMAHQPAHLDAAVPENAHVGVVLAPGYTFQGQLLRRALVETVARGAIPSIEPGKRQEPEPEAQERLPI